MLTYFNSIRHMRRFFCQKTLASTVHRAIICESCSCHSQQTECHRHDRTVSSNAHRSTDPVAYHAYSTTQHGNSITLSNALSVRHFRKEVRAAVGLLERSGFNTPEKLIGLCFPSTDAAGRRHFSTSSKSGQQQQKDDKSKNQEDPDKDKDPEEEEKMPVVARLMLVFWMAFFIYVMFRVQNVEETSSFKYISWNEFYYDMLSKGEVEEVLVRPEQELAFIKLYPGAVVKNKQVSSELFTMKIVDPYKFEEKIRRAEAEVGIRSEKGIPVSYQRENSYASIIFMGIVLCALFLIFKNVKFQMPNASDMFAGERKAKFVRADLQQHQGKPISFQDVAGLHEAKVEITEFVDYIKHPEKYNDLGGKAPKGALLLGPPGCGKTLLAKALASEAGVPFLALAGSEFVEMLGGLGAARVRDLFKEARDKSPCIIYIDEIDAIGRKRSGDNWSFNTEEEHTLNQLLVEMDGMSTTEGVIMIGSTNRSDILDKALLRPGRFDRHIMIDFPTLAERKEMFDMYLRSLKLGKLPENYSGRLAQLSPGMTGADIANICNEAALHAARDKHLSIVAGDFEYAVERVVAGVAKKSRVLSPQEKKVVAYHEAGHALIGWLLEHTDALLKVSIIPRTNSALGFAQYEPQDKHLFSKEELFEKMCMMLGGRVAESVVFNSVTSGAQNDLERITRLAYNQIRQLGMNERVGNVAFPGPGEDREFGTRPYSKYLTSVIDEEAKLLVGRAYKTTEKIITENKAKLRAIAEALLEKETLTFKDVEQLIGPPNYAKTSNFSGMDVSKEIPLST